MMPLEACGFTIILPYQSGATKNKKIKLNLYYHSESIQPWVPLIPEAP